MFKLEEINKENVQVCFNTEYILIDDFVDSNTLTESQLYFDKYKEVIGDNSNHIALKNHPLMSMLREESTYTNLLNRVNDVWNENCTNFQLCVNLMQAEHILPVHEDNFWSDVPIRGILYLNGVYGTHFHEFEESGSIRELGGKPGQLLLFKTDSLGWHSAGLFKTTNEERSVISIMFSIGT
jgi:hypothetical protein